MCGCKNIKCLWCIKRKEDLWTIKVLCKYYNKNICEGCYDRVYHGKN